jgi:Cu/Ag efflux protein CusF
MKLPTRLVRGLGLALGASVLFALSGCTETPAPSGTGQGTIVALDTEDAEITLDHGEIPGLMGAMTMPFPVADPKLLEGLQEGQRVEFDLEYRGGMYTVQDIRPAVP